MAKTIKDLSLEQILALAKLIPDDSKIAKDARAAMKEGRSYPLDFTVHVEGIMNIGKDNQCPCQFRLPVLQIIHKMAEKLNGITVEAVLREVIDDIKSKKEIDLEPLQRAIKAAEEMFEATTELRKGKVTLDVVATGLNAKTNKEEEANA